MCAWCLQKSEEVVGSPGTEVIIDGCKLSCECWEPKPWPLQEQQVLTVQPSPSPAPVCRMLV